MTYLPAAVRALAHRPLITAVSVLSLALGIGANTAIFSIADALLLRALPVQQPDRLVLLSADDTWFGSAWSNPIWESIRDRRELHDGAFAFRSTGFDVAERGVVDEVQGLQASGAMFDVLGVGAALGRTFSDRDDRRDGGPDGPVAVLSHDFWRRRYGGDADILGRTISLDRIPFTIIGITPAGFFGPDVGRSFDVAVPLGTVALLNGDAGPLESRSSWWLRVMLRLAPDRTLEQTTALLRSVQPQIAEETRPLAGRPQEVADHLSRPLLLLPAATGASELRDSYRRPVLALMGIVAFTLLIACGNIANLQLARSESRRHELSIRAAMGASGRRLARQLLAESLLLSGIGAVFAAAFAFGGSRLVVAMLSNSGNPVFLDVGVDWRALAFTGAVGIGTALLFGTLPALRAAGAAPLDALQEHGRGTSSSRRGVAGALVMVQFALSLVLLLGAGLFVRTFASLATLDLGIEKDRVLLVHMGAPGAGVDPGARGAMYERILQGVRARPEVAGAALSMITPLSGSNTTRIMEFPGRPSLPESERRVWLNVITPGWFDALGTPIVSGRDFDDRDRPGAPGAVVVNQAFVTKYFGGESPLGRLIQPASSPGTEPTPLEIVGVAGDAVYRSVREPVPPTMYWPLAQQAQVPGGLSLVVRPAIGAPASATLVRAVTAAIDGVERDLSLVVQPLADEVDAALTQERLLATLSGFFGVVGLLLAALGLYGTTSYAVARRRVELGIRMALGTTPTGILRLVLLRVVLLMAGGTVIGAAVWFWASTLASGLLFGLTPRDPGTMFGAVALLLGVGAVAGWLPASRAARIDPAAVLRDG